MPHIDWNFISALAAILGLYLAILTWRRAGQQSTIDALRQEAREKQAELEAIQKALDVAERRYMHLLESRIYGPDRRCNLEDEA